MRSKKEKAKSGATFAVEVVTGHATAALTGIRGV
jgi:hypothetical protein